MSSKNFQLILESIPTEDTENLTQIKTILLTDLSFDLEQAKEIIENLPSPIATSDDLRILHSFSALFANTGAILDILPIVEETIIPASVNFFAENIDNKLNPEQVIQGKAISHKDYSLFEVNKSDRTTNGKVNLLTNNPIIFNSLISIFFASIMLGFSFLIFSDKPIVDTSAQLREQIKLLQKEALDNKPTVEKFITEDIYLAKFVIAGINFECSVAKSSNNLISSITIEAKNNKDSNLAEEFEKVLINNLRVNNSVDNTFTARGVMKIYINQAGQLVRPTAQAFIGGSFNSETDEISLRILVNRGYDVLPTEEKFIIDPVNLEETKIFIDRNVALIKQSK